ncbi:hypothetical protein NB640_10785 [Oxalobacter vibrioformis]|uniref:Uncharacterized protein n=1 Tax=Oxalobacter vibrioformis TaxID=933080 RepID=A0A9E9LYC4_9BURK|nr:hypothetical protein [Oxalobacter vibrioformis]WAW09699.1 hypothetical protein NB640_10785 [Oxalobacter vibrioformis]
MTHQNSNGTAPEKSAAIKDCPLEMVLESEGGFPCGEFLWDDEDAAAAAAPIRTL